jgi:hypothetical protein
MALPSGVAGVFDPVNVAGVLFNKTDVRTPLFNMLGGVTVGSREFLTGSEFSIGSASQPAISETASLTAPTPTFTERTQAKNVTQMFHRAVSVTYRKMSDQRSLTGLNLEGLSNNVPSETSFQIANRLAEIRNDIEYTILNGVYSLATTPDMVDKTRGLNAAITSGVVTAGGDELVPDMLIDVAKYLSINSPYGVQGVVGILNPEQIVQLNKIILNQGQRASMDDNTVAGSNLLSYLTPFGTLKFLEGGHRYQPNGTATFANLGLCHNVLNDVPGKGNFFYEPLAKTGAGEAGQIFGQWGLDSGHEWMHAKITGLATTTTPFTAPQMYVVNEVS